MEKKQYHFNWFDAFVCLLLAVLVAGAFFKFAVSDKTASAGAADTITYTVQVPAGKESTIDGIRVGDTLYDSDSGNVIGTVTNVAAEPAETIISYPDGTAEWGTIEDRYDLYLTVEGTGVITASRQYMINKTYQVNVGAQKNMNTQFRSFYGRIMSVS